ncbi:hypothetical protein GCM10009828_019100 [Actinoplanes couchii]
MDKTVEQVEVVVDEAMLAPLGWAITEVRARLVTEPTSSGKVVQSVSVAGTAVFDPEEWVDRFSQLGDAPHVMVTLQGRDLPGLSLAGLLIRDRIGITTRQSVRFTETSRPWHVGDPVAASVLTVRITGYDLDSTRLVTFGTPAEPHTVLPVTVIDETTRPAMRVSAIAHAEIAGSGLTENLGLSLSGVVELDPADDADVPVFDVEITDETDFLLLKNKVQLFGRVSATHRRDPTFLACFTADVHGFAGTPTRAVVRIRDAAVR